MKRLLSTLSICFFVFGSASVNAQAFVKFAGIDGEVIVEGYEGWSEFTSVTQKIEFTDISQAGPERLRELPEFQQLAIIKPLDKASVKIAERTLRGVPTDLVEIEWVLSFESGLKPYYTYELQNVRIVEYDSKGIGTADGEINADGRIYEEILLDFEEIKVTYREYDSDGNFLGATEYSWSKPN